MNNSNFQEMEDLRKTKAKTITLDTNLIKKVEDIALAENRNFSNMVETLLLKATKEIRL
nr:hypothetical protein [uncultured Psychroserpens sp.]